jgi:hypothetical protein
VRLLDVFPATPTSCGWNVYRFDERSALVAWNKTELLGKMSGERYRGFRGTIRANNVSGGSVHESTAGLYANISSFFGYE